VHSNTFYGKEVDENLHLDQSNGFNAKRAHLHVEGGAEMFMNSYAA
jgi:hypothetical protein